MKEIFLQFIWQFQLFQKEGLALSSGETINIIHPGTLNDQSGPDFLQGHVQYNDLDFYGNIEIHLRSGDWYKHKHEQDDAYNNVILHVVLEEDKRVENQDGDRIPCLILKGKIPLNFYKNYENLFNNSNRIACSDQLKNLNQSILTSMLDRVMMERLENKSSEVFEVFENVKQDWEETAFKVLQRSFGFKRNKNGFIELAELVGFKTIKKICNEQEDVEALLFGLAGFLAGKRKKNPYFDALKSKYEVLKQKAGIDNELNPVIWKFFRLRPANFPTLRIAQLSALIYNTDHLLSIMLSLDSIHSIEKFVKYPVSKYWENHFNFSSEKASGVSEIGSGSVESIAINAIVPLWFAFGKRHADDRYFERSLKLLESISPENNKITRYWKDMGFENSSAFESQALIQLYNSYCLNRNCLKCNVGVTLVREY